MSRAAPRARRRRDYLVTTVLVVITALMVVPLLWVFLSAFKDETEIFGNALGWPHRWTSANFRSAWTKGGFQQYFLNSVIVGLASTFITVLVACPAGYVFGKLATPAFGRLFYVLLFTITLPIESIVVPIFYQMRALGLVDSRLGLTLILVATGTPLGVFIMRNFFRDLPNELLEAAQVDGASHARAFFSVMAPLAGPAISAVAVFSFLSAWNEYLLALLLLTSNETRTLPLGLTEFQGLYGSDFGALMAGSVLAMVPSMLVYLCLQRSFTRGLLAGSIK